MLKNLGALVIVLSMSMNVWASKEIKLPAPDKSNQTSLMQALSERQSDKDFINKKIDDKTLSTLLWSAYGVNRDNGKRTIPTALGKNDLQIYIADNRGTWLYDAENNTLLSIGNIDIRPHFQTQDYMKNVPVILIYVGSHEDYASMHAGSAYQNVELYVVANQMASVVRGHFNKEDVQKALNLPYDKRVIISQAVGYKK